MCRNAEHIGGEVEQSPRGLLGGSRRPGGGTGGGGRRWGRGGGANGAPLEADTELSQITSLSISLDAKHGRQLLSGGTRHE